MSPQGGRCEERSVIFLAGRCWPDVFKQCGTRWGDTNPLYGFISDMNTESATPQWAVLTAELRAYRDQQQQTWGDVDSALLGRYLAGEATSAEKSRVEAAFEAHPDLRALAELVRDVLGEGEPSLTSVQQPRSEGSRPRLLPFTSQPKVRRPFLVRLRRNGALVAAACLLLALGIALVGQMPSSDDAVAGAGWRDLRASRDADNKAPFFLA